MPAVTVDDLTTLQRLRGPGLGDAVRPVLGVTTAPRGFEGEGFPVRRAFAGVDLAAADDAKERIGRLVAGTRTALSVGSVGAFGGMVRVPPGMRTPVLVLSDDWDGPWVQVEGEAEVLHMPEAADGLVDYYRCIAGEHPDWDEYRAAMRTQGKSLIRVTPTRLGPVATGGFPARLA